MTWRVVAAAAALSAAFTAPALAATTSPTPRPGDVQVVATLPVDEGSWGVFAESMAADGRDRLVVGWTTWWTSWDGTPAEGSDGHNRGHVARLGPDGRLVPIGDDLDLGTGGMQSGLAVDSDGAVYVGFASFSADPAPGVFRYGADGHPSRWMTLPANAFPNGLLVDGTNLYVSDSALGVVWRGSTQAPSTPAEPWFADARLLPDPAGFGIGANGLAVRDGDMYMVSSDRGLLLRAPIDRNGQPGSASEFAKDLLHADGLAFDRTGRLWVTVNEAAYDTGSLVVIDRRGTRSTVPIDGGAMDYPVQAVPLRGGDEVYYLNAGVYQPAPQVMAVPGLVPGPRN